MGTLESLEELDDVGMFECGHCVDLLYETLLELWVFDHFLLGETLYGVEGGRGGGLGCEQDMSESALSYLAHTVELVSVEDVSCLQLLTALYHYLIPGL